MVHAADPATATPVWRRAVGLAAAVTLGGVLLVAAWAKAIDPESFRQQIRSEGLDLFGLAGGVALAALALEIALGAALVLGIRRWWVLLPTAGLVAFFLFLTGRAYWRFEQGLLAADEGCGCFGNLLMRTPAEAFWQDLVLLGVPLALAGLGRPRRATSLPRRRLALVGVVTVAGLLLAWRAPELPLDDWATRLRPGVSIAALCAGEEGAADRICLDAVVSELDRGRNWVIISSLEEESFLQALPRLNELALAGGGPGMWVVTAASPETVAGFSWTRAPAFEVREAPASLLRPLHRRLPRSFLVEDGTVVETRSGLPLESV